MISADLNKKILIHSRQGEFCLSMSANKSAEIWIDHFSPAVNPESIKFFLQMEPDEYFHLNEELIAKQKEYDFILTYEELLLNKCNNAILFEYGTKLKEGKEYSFPSKNFSVSHVCGTKYHTLGHVLRQDVFYLQNEITIPTNFFISQVLTNHYQNFFTTKEIENKYNNPILNESKYPLFDSMFSLCVENTQKLYYFSEKLIDCLLCKSIPIFFGCPNINQYFDIDGIIIINSLEDFKNKVNKLTPEYYLNKQKIIQENYLKALYWSEYSKRLNKIVDILSNQ